MRLFSRRALALVVGSAVAAAASAQTPPATPAPAKPPVTPAPVAPPPAGGGAAPVLPPPAGGVPAPATNPLAVKAEPRPTGTAARVNGQDIPEVAVWRALRQFPKEEQEVARKEILSHLTENALIDQYLTALKVEVQTGEVDKLIGELKEELKKVQKDYAKELEQMMLTEAEFRSEVTAQMKWDKFLKDRASDAELKKMFDAAPSMFDGSMVRASHILLTPGADKKAQDEAAGKLRGIKKVCEDEAAKAVAALPATATALEKDAARTKKVSELFAAYAKEYSTCPSKKEGGDLSFFPRVGAMVEPFAKAAFELKVGDMSDVVATEFGYHVVLVTAKQAGKQPTFEQAKEAVRAVYAMRLRDAVIGQMKPAAKIELAAAAAPTTAGSPASVTPMK
jgi:peptidyl-prolyl cis-trans isomerase C